MDPNADSPDYVTEQSIVKLFRVRKTVSQMLCDRGYALDPRYRDETLEEFKALWTEAVQQGAGRERFVILVGKQDDPEEKILVYFPDENKRVGVKPIRMLAEKMTENKIKHAIMVVRQAITTFAKNAIQETMGKLRIETFHENELVVNITKHELVPQHQPMTRKEKEFLLERYQLKESQIPRIQENDPIARYFGLEKGDVIKVIRPSETAGRYVTYRFCV